MPRYTTSQTYTDGNTQIVALQQQDSDLQLALVAAPSEGAAPPKAEDEDLEVKLRRIIEQVPVRVNNTSGSSAGSGSGDFHQYRQMRRREQDRLARMEVDYQKRKEEAEFLARREARLKAAEDRTAKKRAKRQKKKKQKHMEKRSKVGPSSCQEAGQAADLDAEGLEGSESESEEEHPREAEARVSG